MQYIPDISLRDYSTLHVGGTAKGLFVVESDGDLGKVFDEIAKMGARSYIIGEGSNCYFGDGPHDDLVLLRIAIKGIEIKPSVIEGKVLTIGAGVMWDDAVARAGEEGLWGIESLAGIPGTVGAAPIQNIGAYGAEVADAIEAIEVYDCAAKEIRGIPRRLCGFGYRTSIFNTSAQGKYIILRVRLWLHEKKRRSLPKEIVTTDEGKITPREVGDQIRKIRASKLPNYKEQPNCGSFFKNPFVDNSLAIRLRKEYSDMPQYPEGEHVKLSAGWLIEHAGLKGKSWGNVSVSDKHALVLMTNGKSKASEVAAAISEITEVVSTKFGVMLSPEPNFIP